MALNMTKLAASARIHRSANRTLTAVWQMCAQYNSLPATAGNKDRVDLIQLITRLGGNYLTSKPPQEKELNQRRWAGLQDLMEQIGAEAKAIGVRMLSGPTDFKRIGVLESYWLELLDPMHRPGYVLSPRYASWLVDTDAIRTKQSFWAYIGTKPTGGDLAKDVAYLNETGGPKRYQIEFDGDLLVESIGGQICSTRQHTTHFSGDGWAIFVVSPTEEIYSASHIVGKLHHSSFLGGRPVMAAGEMVAEDGVIKVLSAKSGHYRPSADDLLRLVQRFPMIPSDAIIRPDLLDYSDRGGVIFYRVGDFRANGLKARPLSKAETLAGVPSWAKGPDAMEMFDKMISISGRTAPQVGSYDVAPRLS